MYPQSMRRPVSTWCRSPQPVFRLICVPYAGAGVSVFHNWVDSLGEGVEVCAVQLAGRDTQTGLPPFRRVTALVDSLVTSLDFSFDLPFAIFGHSLGGLIAFELARALRAHDKPAPRHLFLSACRAPGRPGPWPMHHLPEDAFVRELRTRYDGIPSAILRDPELLRHFLPVLRADMEMVETWRDAGGAPFDFPLTAFCGTEDREIARVDVEPWNEQTGARTDLHMINGNHFFVNTARADVLRVIARHLERYCGTDEALSAAL
jgi:medium-chain acyl-[acyl-carrier-protein] hydrolase